jgi:hypothetical protein
MKQRGRITAAQLMATLEADPEFVARREKQERELRMREAEHLEAELPIVAELRQNGLKVRSVWDLVNTSQRYPNAIATLVAHLTRAYPPAVREGIARALAVKEAAPYWQLLADCFASEREPRAREGLAVAVAGATTPETLPQLIALISDPRHGSSRVLLVGALEYSTDPKAEAALLSLADDPDLTIEVNEALTRRHRRLARRKKNLGEPSS